jgi:hypothetical protein
MRARTDLLSLRFGAPVSRVRLAGIAFAVSILAAESAWSIPILWDTGTGHTNHWYEAFQAPTGISWEDAQADAVSRGGYLATLLAAEENDFVFALIDSPAYWVPESPGSSANLGPWLGGFQPSGSAEPGGGWTWLNSDGPFAFTNWHAGEPSDGVGAPHGMPESRLAYLEFGGRSNKWNDMPENYSSPPGNLANPIAYVVEYNAVPEPTSLALLGLGLSLLSWKKRRTN